MRLAMIQVRCVASAPEPPLTSLCRPQRHTWPLGRFPGKPSACCFRQYSDLSGPSSNLANTTPPAKYVPNIRQAFYKICVQNGFEGTFEEFSKRSHFLAYERAVQLGKFQGTYDAWRLESRNREPGGRSSSFHD